MNITVYCGSAFGKDPAFGDAAYELGVWMATSGHTLVYGGADFGLMGRIANAALDQGGQVIGVLPGILLEREPPNERLTKLYLVDTMAQRKGKLIELGDAFIAMPGGPGTLEELTEILSLAKIGTAPGPLYLLNINGFYDELAGVYDKMLSHGFMDDVVSAYLHVCDSTSELIDSLERFAANA